MPHVGTLLGSFTMQSLYQHRRTSMRLVSSKQRTPQGSSPDLAAVHPSMPTVHPG
jgi:hypothetical protein